MTDEASTAQGIEQPGGELAPANTGAREGDAPFQISASPAAIYVSLRSSGKLVHALPLQHQSAREAGRAHASLPGVGGCHPPFGPIKSNRGAAEPIHVLCAIRQDALRHIGSSVKLCVPVDVRRLVDETIDQSVRRGNASAQIRR
jgi:hypothetical protein